MTFRKTDEQLEPQPPRIETLSDTSAQAQAEGQLKSYTVLAAEERDPALAVREVRRSYKHLVCGAKTIMSQAIAETYARDPTFYSGTFCAQCGGHFPVGADGKFVWYTAAGVLTDEKVGV
jgi:hypothetical protein